MTRRPHLDPAEKQQRTVPAKVPLNGRAEAIRQATSRVTTTAAALEPVTETDSIVTVVPLAEQAPATSRLRCLLWCEGPKDDCPIDCGNAPEQGQS